MNNFTGHAPNIQLLNDDVIVGVKLRSGQSVRFYTPGAGRVDNYSYEPRLNNTSIKRPSSILSPVERLPPSSTYKHVYRAAEQAATKARNVASEAERLLLNQARQRKRQRDNQRRYRKRQDDRILTLEKVVRQLNEDIKHLDCRRRSIPFSIFTEDTVWNVAVEYFRVFHNGYPAVQATAGLTQTNTQLDFVKARVMDDVVLSTGRGVDVLLENWSWATFWFRDVKIELLGMKRDAAGWLHANVETSMTIRERTLRHVFPHLCSYTSDGALSPLAQTLLNRRITMRGVTHFEWDAGYDRVSSLIAESDMWTPMLYLLGSIEDVSWVFDNALISLTFELRKDL